MKISEEQIVKIAKALADKTRVKILREIAKRGTISCGDAVEMSVLSQPTVSHHIKLLVEAGLVLTQKKGRHVSVSVNHKTLDEFAAVLPGVSKR